MPGGYISERTKGQMDNQRLLPWAFFGMMVWFTYQAWMREYPPVTATPPTPAVENSLDAPAGQTDLPALVELPSMNDAPSVTDAPVLEPTAALGPDIDPAAGDEIIIVTTDVLRLEIDTRGGSLRRAQLLAYPVAKDQPDTLVELLSPTPYELGLIQTGLRSTGDGEEANHLAQFSTTSKRFDLDGRDEIEIPLNWSNDSGVRVEKTIRLKRGSYTIEIEQRVINGSAQEWRGAAYAQLQRRSRPIERSMFDVDTYSFDGPLIYDGEKSAKQKRDDLLEDGPTSFVSSTGWVAAIQHHFLTAVVPAAGTEQRYNVSLRGDGGVSLASAIGPATTVDPGRDSVFNTSVFVGPKLQAQLEQITPTLKLTVDYGWLTIISEPLFWLLSKVFSFVGNWGVAIILVTALIKSAFYKLTQTSGRSMAKMREIQPRMKALQDRYKDDRQASYHPRAGLRLSNIIF
jgi:YidC/Oxa1 family membrane protein insertase